MNNPIRKPQTGPTKIKIKYLGPEYEWNGRIIKSGDIIEMSAEDYSLIKRIKEMNKSVSNPLTEFLKDPTLLQSFKNTNITNIQERANLEINYEKDLLIELGQLKMSIDKLEEHLDYLKAENKKSLNSVICKEQNKLNELNNRFENVIDILNVIKPREVIGVDEVGDIITYKSHSILNNN